MEVNLFVAFTLGLFSSVHCLGMCGGIITALSLGLPETVRQDRLKFVTLVGAYNLGRVFSYAVAGALAGMFGYIFLGLVRHPAGHYGIRILAGVILVLLGLHLAGWLPVLKRIEGAGARIWRVIRPLGQYFLPVDSPPKALLMGCLWGWLPCGLVYSVLLWSATAADPISGSLMMFCFGLGTLPSLITAGLLGDSLQRLFARAHIRKVFALIIISFGIVSPWLHFNQPLPGAGHDMQHMQ